MKYTFLPNGSCNMCLAGASDQRVIGQRLNRSQGMNPARVSGISVTVQKCRRCGLVSPNPLPVPENLSDHYGIPPEEYWQTAKFESQGFMLEKEVEKAKALLGPRDGLKALDIGVGIGRVMKTLEHHGFEAHGIEPSEPFYNFAQDNSELPEDRLKMMKLEEAEYPQETFDFVTFGAVLEHLYNPADALEKALRWMKPGGIIQAEVPNSRHLVSKIINLYFRLRGTRYVTNLSPMHSPFHIYEFDLESFRRHGKRAGYEIVDHDYMVCRIFHLPKIVHPPLAAWMRARNSGMQLTVYLRKIAD